MTSLSMFYYQRRTLIADKSYQQFRNLTTDGQSTQFNFRELDDEHTTRRDCCLIV